MILSYDRENHFCLKLFLSLNISDFSWFWCKNCNSLEKAHTSSYPATPLQKLMSCQAPPPLFWKFGKRFNTAPPAPPAPQPAERWCRLCHHHDAETSELIVEFAVGLTFTFARLFFFSLLMLSKGFPNKLIKTSNFSNNILPPFIIFAGFFSSIN